MLLLDICHLWQPSLLSTEIGMGVSGVRGSPSSSLREELRSPTCLPSEDPPCKHTCHFPTNSLQKSLGQVTNSRSSGTDKDNGEVDQTIPKGWGGARVVGGASGRTRKGIVPSGRLFWYLILKVACLSLLVSPVRLLLQAADMART